MSREFRVAVVGATGLVGETMIQVLEERNFPVSELHALASNRSLGKRVEFKGRSLPVQELAGFDFSKADIGLFSPGAEVSREYAPKAAAAGFHEPSLVFMTGTSTLLTDGSGAADFLRQGSCRFALVEQRSERGFAQRAEAIGLRYNVAKRIEGYNISQGRAISIAIFRSEDTE